MVLGKTRAAEGLLFVLQYIRKFEWRFTIMWQLIGYYAVAFVVGFYCGFNRGAVEGFKRAILMMGMIGKSASEGKNFEEKEGKK